MNHKKQLFFALLLLTTIAFAHPAKQAALKQLEARVIDLLNRRTELMLAKHKIYQEILSLCADLQITHNQTKNRFNFEKHLETFTKKYQKNISSILELEQRINATQTLNTILKDWQAQEQQENHNRIQTILTLFYEIQELNNQIQNLDKHKENIQPNEQPKATQNSEE